MNKPSQIKEIISFLNEYYPKPQIALHYEKPYELLFATILSAQCTDKQVNKVTPSLFKKFKSLKAFAEADILEIEDAIKSIGFYKSKARSIQISSQMLLNQFSGKVPQTLEELIQLRGVGRKTANVVLGEIFQAQGVVVDTHVKRLSYRLGLTKNTQPEKIEQDLMKIIPKDHWARFSHQLILHGRAVCKARKPQCEICKMKAVCIKKGV